MDVQKFLESAREGIVTVEFTKIDTGELRVMPCTLKAEMLPSNLEIKSQKTSNDHLVVWAMDKEAWRSFRVNTVVRWYKGTDEPKS